MANPGEGRPGRDVQSWLARKIKLRNLKSLPPYRANGGGIIHQPEPYARLLLMSLQGAGDDLQASARLKDDARAFRSWVEGNQLDLCPPPAPASRPRTDLRP